MRNGSTDQSGGFFGELYININLPSGRSSYLNWSTAISSKGKLINKLERTILKDEKATRFLVDEKNCEPISLGDSSLFSDDDGFLKQALLSIWSIRQSEIFLESEHLPTRSKAPSATKVLFYTQGLIARDGRLSLPWRCLIEEAPS